MHSTLSQTRSGGSAAAPARPTTPKSSAAGFSSRLITALAFPVFYVLNRPALQPLAEAAYDFALRWNGIAIGFKGHHGLNYAEERFLQKYLPTVGAGVLFDVGANAGSYTLVLRHYSPGSTIHAFEPHPRTFTTLQQRAAAPGTTLVNLALSDEAGTMQLHDFAESDGSTQASLAVEAVGLFDAATVSHSVQVTTIDDYLDRTGVERVDLLKIDTEGFDINVLRGARSALARGAIRAIQFEFIPADIARRVSMRDFFEVLEGFRLYRLCVNGSLMPLKRYDVKRCEIYVTHNIIALPV